MKQTKRQCCIELQYPRVGMRMTWFTLVGVRMKPAKDDIHSCHGRKRRYAEREENTWERKKRGENVEEFNEMRGE